MEHTGVMDMTYDIRFEVMIRVRICLVNRLCFAMEYGISRSPLAFRELQILIYPVSVLSRSVKFMNLGDCRWN